MALGYMFIMIIVFIAVSCLGVLGFLLIKDKKWKDRIYYFLIIWGVFLAGINFMGVPSNYVGQKMFAAALGILSVVAIVIKLKRPDKTNYAYFLGVFSLIFTLADLLIL